MLSRRLAFAVMLAVLAAAVLGGGVQAAPSKPIVALDATSLPEGPLAAWNNAGTLGGTFKSSEAQPQVKTIAGVKAVDFSGKEYMLADFTAPASVTGDKPFTVVARTYARTVVGEKALISWANRPDNCLEIEYGDAALWGAIGTWSAYTTGWNDQTPATGKWHTLVYSYQGGKDGEFQAWSDGDLIASKKFSLNTKTDRPFVLGATQTGDPDKNPGYIHNIDGAIASLVVYDRPFSTIECYNTCGLTSAYQESPGPNAMLDTLTTTLKWQAGSKDAARFEIYVGTDKTAVERATNKQPVGKPGDSKRIYKGKLAARTTQFGPLPLELNKTYYWRIDEVDASGKLLQRGRVSKFSTETANATEPAPSDGYIFVEGGKKVLTWKPGKYAAKQNVYIGESAAEVLMKKKPDIANLPVSITSINFPVENPELGKSYYWRVETVNSGKLGVSKGDVWSVRTVSKKLPIYIVSGQSNAVGCSLVSGTPAKYMGANKNAIIFIRGECRLGPYGWAYVKPGLGSGFGDRDGHGTIGPELTFAANMAPKDPKQVIGIFKCAWGGTNLGAQWRPPSAGGQVGELYTNWVAAYKEAMAALDPAFEPEIVGMIWMQGESDSGDQKMAEDYGKNLTCFINDIRAEVKKPNMPFVHAQISKAPAWEPRGGMIRDAEAQVAKAVPFTATFPTDDYGMCDPWHYDTPGMVSLGERFAKAMKQLEAKK